MNRLISNNSTNCSPRSSNRSPQRVNGEQKEELSNVSPMTRHPHDNIINTVQNKIPLVSITSSSGQTVIPHLRIQTLEALSPSKFFLQDDDYDYSQNDFCRDTIGSAPVKKLLNPFNNSSLESSSYQNRPTSFSISSNDTLDFPTESTNAYSYAHLSPNSLALRLNVLKRSLEILIERPELINSLNGISQDALSDHGVSPPLTPINNTTALFNPKVRNLSSSSFLPQQHTSKETQIQTKELKAKVGSHPEELKRDSQIKIETNASSAALAAFFRNGSSNNSSSSLPQVPKSASTLSFSIGDNIAGNDPHLEYSPIHILRKNNKFAKRSSSLNTPFLMNSKRINDEDVAMYAKKPLREVNYGNLKPETSPAEMNDKLTIYENIRNKLKSMITLLNEADCSIDSSGHNPSDEIALNLHNLSLSNVNDESKEKFLQRKLLYALATPFYESISANNMINLNRNISSAALYHTNNTTRHLSTSEKNRIPSIENEYKPRNQEISPTFLPNISLQLEPPARIPLKKFNSFDDSVINPSFIDQSSKSSRNLVNINYTTARPFHSLSTLKNLTPQAIITCQINSPWHLRAVNDLSTLIFGLKNNNVNIKELKLMDLIAHNSKDFVLQKIMKRLSNDSSSKINRSNHYNKDIIFAGEIVAVKAQPNAENSSTNEIHWCSLWAKCKNNLIIFMFDKIPCSSIDLKIQNRNSCWEIESINEVTGNLLSDSNYRNEKLLCNISKSLDNELNEPENENKLAIINDQRYFTLNLQNKVFPCAVLAEIDQDNTNDETGSTIGGDMVLKIHTLPYIAGIFVISASNYSILSYNRSISKNLFGYGDLIGQPINKIIPNFTKLIEFSSSTKKIVNFLNDLVTKSTPERHTENPNKYLLPGLVLPEHFFRRIQAKFEAHKIIKMRNKSKRTSYGSAVQTPIKAKIELSEEIDSSTFDGKSEEEVEDDLFLNSKGIYGKHRDGSTLVIDVQVRVSSIDTLVLWVTYSSDAYQNTHDRDSKFAHKNNSLSDDYDIASKKKVKFSDSDQDSMVGESEGVCNTSPSFHNEDLDDFERNLSSKPSSSSLLSLKYKSDGAGVANTPVRIRRSNSLLSDLNNAPQSSNNNHNNNNKQGEFLNTSKRDSLLMNSIGLYQKGEFDILQDDHDDEFDSITEVSTPPTTAPANDIKSVNIIVPGNEFTNEKVPSMTIKNKEDEISAHEENTNISIMLESELQKADDMKYNDWKNHCHTFPEKIGALKRTKKFSDFLIIKEMGRGAYGRVVLVSHKEDPNYEIILKCIYKDRILVDLWTRDRNLGTIPTEIQIMAFLTKNPHPNILKLIDFFEDDECFYVELPIHGSPPAIDLFDYIEIKKSLSEVEMRYIFRQIVQSVNHLHENGLVHRDIKDENVIIDENSVVKLIDYGSSAFLYNGPFDVFVGTMEYASPEVLHGSLYDGRPQDVWSLGILLYTMLYKENPFYNVDEIMEGELSVPYIISEDCCNLITRILNRDVSKRPTVKEILEDPWLKI